jgi:hypothetical protein
MKKYLEDECDGYWRKIIKLRANNKCQLSDCKRSATDSHHIAGRSGSVVYDLSNGIALCRRCHDHPHMAEMNAKIIEAIGQAEFDRLEAKAREIKQYRKWELEILRDELKEIYNKMKEVNHDRP